MIRPISPDDTSAVIDLAKKLKMFDQDGIEHIRNNLANHRENRCHDLWFVSDHNDIKGLIYCVPEPMTKGTWNILMLLVDPENHRQGHGSALIHYVEQTLIEQGERLVIVETSNLDEFESARSFYLKCGYREEARICNFYAAGEDKIIFTKALKNT